ncbi:hypothetical protein EJB05_21968 [Eragrostis curvula]|uniref:Uncharacterized protein n=1 Tax=Eragrostis curvula TaxID=38414 RepID=A0A5J9V2B3_9POAL|nr:hypothetical protein EJB05_21968 [Eragrostis curvula]
MVQGRGTQRREGTERHEKKQGKKKDLPLQTSMVMLFDGSPKKNCTSRVNRIGDSFVFAANPLFTME